MTGSSVNTLWRSLGVVAVAQDLVCSRESETPKIGHASCCCHCTQDVCTKSSGAKHNHFWSISGSVTQESRDLGLFTVGNC